MTFKDWIYGTYPNPATNGQWGLLHILTLVLCVVLIVAIAFIFKNKSEKTKKIVLWVLVGFILLFELSRRIIDFSKTTDLTLNSALHFLLPRPWCAISCWTLIFAAIVNKKWLYNFASYSALLCSLIFFAYPSVGFNNKYILFENLYSIATHSLLLVTSISLITLRFTQFEYKTIWKDLLCLLVVLIYTFIEIYVLKIESDPMYFMPNNEVQEILGLNYGLFLVIYIVFMTIYINLFYLIDDRKNVKNVFKKKK